MNSKQEDNILVDPYNQELCPLSANSSGELDVLGHDGHSLGVDGAQVGVLEETNQVGLTGFL